jgi:hypothetical protein
VLRRHTYFATTILAYYEYLKHESTNQIKHPSETRKKGQKNMDEETYNDEKLKQIYAKVVEEPNKYSPKKGFIKCPECGEEILMIPTLRVMNEAIENHVHIHRKQLKTEPIKEHQKAIYIRLTLMSQVLQQACRPQMS